MKFNIGDTVIGNSKATKRYVFTQAGWTGTVTAIGPGHFFAQAGKNGTKFQLQYEYFDLLKPVATTSKIVITGDGKTTLARLYYGNCVIRRAEAKCSPEDTYDFATGANLAYDRLMRPETLTASVKPQDKPKFEAGDKAKVIANTCHHHMMIGDIVTLTDNTNIFAGVLDLPAWHYKEQSPGFISERDLEPYAEPDKPTTLKYKVGDRITARGNVCGISGPGTIVEVDAKSSLCNYRVSFDAQPGARIWAYTGSVESLVEPSKPTAPANKYDAMSDDELVGTVCDIGMCSASKFNIRHADCPLKNTPAYNSMMGCTDFLHAHPEFRPVLVQYLVDEDAAKEPKPEPKPVKHLYSGKVVCVETHDDFTVGKVYTFKDGKVTDDSWNRRPMNSYSAESLEDWNRRCGDCIVRFIEYKGEA